MKASAATVTRHARKSVALMTLALAVAACGSTGAIGSRSTRASESLSAGSYLASSSSYALLLSFTVDRGKLDGTLDYAYRASSGGQVKSARGTLAGSVSGSAITLVDNEDVLAVSGTVSGRVDATGFSLSFPQTSGQLADVQFAPATDAAYNAALARLDRRAAAVRAADAQATDAAAAAAHAAAEQEAGALLKPVCGAHCPPLLSAVAAGYEPLAAFGPGSAVNFVTLAGVPLEVCFAVAGSSVTSLAYEIGNPAAGPTPLYNASGGPADSSPQGCVADPGHDVGVTPVAVSATGAGSWVVRIDQEGSGPPPAAVSSPSAIAQCSGLGGTPAVQGGAPACSNVPYLGPDGATYYVDLPLPPSGPQPVAMNGTSATQAECDSGNYPMGNSGSGPPGRWDGSLVLCLPA